MKARQTNSNVSEGTDLLGYPAGVVVVNEEERIRRAQDPSIPKTRPDMWQELVDNSELLRKGLQEMTRPNILPESLFVKHFLYPFAGMFSQDPEYAEMLSNSTIVHDWCKIAGQPHRAVNIVADGNNNKVLFTVPAIFIRTRSYINRDPNTCFLAMVDKARRQYNFNPESAKAYVDHQLDRFAPNESKDHVVADYVQWLRIFDHYNVPLYDVRDGSRRTVKERGLLNGLNLVRTSSTTASASSKNVSSTTGAISSSNLEEF